MRRLILLLLSAALAWLVAARSRLPEPAAAEAMAAVAWDSGAYNVLDWDLTGPPETAGSAYTAEMYRYFTSCVPTAKHSYTGRLNGKNLLLVLADNWKVNGVNGAQTPALYRLWSEGVRFGEVYAPDWYQGRDGREFALLTGLTPTTVQNRASMSLLAGRDIYLPFALGQGLGDAGYVCRVYSDAPGREASYAALGFSDAVSGAPPADDLAALAEEGPFFAYVVLEDADAEAALEELLRTLEDAGLAGDTAVCVAAGSAQPLRGALFLWGPGLAGVCVDAPCSELDVTPTLLDLFGAEYDARFLSGRDVLADGTGEGPPRLVSLYGSAYSDWVTDAGSYIAAEDAFFPLEGRFSAAQEEARYVSKIRLLVYDRYVFSRRILESNYFRMISGR